MLLQRRKVDVSLDDWGLGWVFPVPDTPSRPAVISQGFSAAHRGVDICYQMSVSSTVLATRHVVWGAPPDTPVLAARDGRVWSVERGPRGWGVVLDHGPPWATYYLHMSDVASLSKGDPIKAGDRIGTMGADPLDAEHIVHLHFETWYKGAGDHAVDPGRVMPLWARLDWTA